MNDRDLTNLGSFGLLQRSATGRCFSLPVHRAWRLRDGSSCTSPAAPGSIGAAGLRAFDVWLGVSAVAPFRR